MPPFLLKTRRLRAFFLLSLLAPIIAASPAWSAEARVAVLLGKEIRPFVEMVEGLEARLGLPVVRHFLDGNGRPYSLSPGAGSLTDKQYDYLVAVGPGALSYLAGQVPASRLIYGMVADPEALVAGRQAPCGVPLRIAPDDQFAAIARNIPSLRRLGVLYDPANNSGWVQTATTIAARHKIRLIPLPVSQRAEIDTALVGLATKVDGLLFIPDSTVIARPIIDYAIKQSLRLRLPVIGYNQYFHDTGAALSFALNYRALGEGTARLLRALIAEGSCPNQAAPYDLLVNEAAFRLLGLPIPGGSP